MNAQLPSLSLVFSAILDFASFRAQVDALPTPDLEASFCMPVGLSTLEALQQVSICHQNHHFLTDSGGSNGNMDRVCSNRDRCRTGYMESSDPQNKRSLCTALRNEDCLSVNSLGLDTPGSLRTRKGQDSTRLLRPARQKPAPQECLE